MLSLVISLALSQTILDSTTKSLEVVTTTTAAVDYTVSFVDYTSTTVTPADSNASSKRNP